MKLGARNECPGRIVMTASITNEWVVDLARAVGDDATAIIKTSDVMIGT
jgi:molybdopterin-binding protein